MNLASSPGSSQFFNVARRITEKSGKIHHVNDVEGRHNLASLKCVNGEEPGDEAAVNSFDKGHFGDTQLLYCRLYNIILNREKNLARQTNQKVVTDSSGHLCHRVGIKRGNH